MFEWARDVGIYEGQNPVTVGTKRTNRNSDAPSTRTDYDRFTDKEVISLFEGLQFVANPQAHTHDTAMPWIMVLAAYSGMRLEEVCGLGVKELGEEDGIWRFDLSGRRLKTESAERKVPIHSVILEAGFLEYCERLREDGQQYLFPSLGQPDKDGRRSSYMSKRFGRYWKKRIVKRARLGFHSFRSTVATKLESAGIPESNAARLLGHKLNTMTYGLYSCGIKVTQLHEVVEAIQYDGLILASMIVIDRHGSAI